MATTLVNLARMGTSTTGTGPITLTTAVPGYLTFAQAGVADGQTVSYGIRDGANSEASQGVYTAASKTLTRSVINSTNANSPINLTINAQVYATALAEDINAKVAKAGDTMSGHLTLPTSPAASNAVRKDYVDTADALKADKTYVDTQDALKVAKVGDTMTGNLTISTSAPAFVFDGSISGNAQILTYKGGTVRWSMSIGDGSPETGGNAGNVFNLASFSDTGAYIASPFYITRPGNASFSSTTASTSSTTGALTVAGGLGVAGTINGIGIGLGAVTGLYGDGGNIAIRGYATGAIVFQDASGATSWGSFNATGFAISSAVVVGAPTGGNKGAGTINATAVYDDNVLLTCVGVQYLVRGEVDLAQWDALSPVKHHRTAHRFVELVKTFDPRDPKQYIDRMLQDEALPGMPTMDGWRHGDMSLGEMHNRLWLATELLASAFVGLHNDYENRLATLMQRVEALEKRT